VPGPEICLHAEETSALTRVSKLWVLSWGTRWRLWQVRDQGTLCGAQPGVLAGWDSPRRLHWTRSGVTGGSLWGWWGSLHNSGMCQSVLWRLKLTFNLNRSLKNPQNFPIWRTLVGFFISLFLNWAQLYISNLVTKVFDILYIYTNITDILYYSHIWD